MPENCDFITQTNPELVQQQGLPTKPPPPDYPNGPYVVAGDKRKEPSPSPPAHNTDLDAAVDSLSHEQLKDVVKAMLLMNPHCLKETKTWFLTPIGMSNHKRKRFEWYKPCKHEYDVEEKDVGSCRYHPGSIYVYEDAKCFANEYFLFRSSDDVYESMMSDYEKISK